MLPPQEQTRTENMLKLSLVGELDDQKDSLPTYVKIVINRATKTSIALSVRHPLIFIETKKPSSMKVLTAEIIYWIIPILYAFAICRLPACKVKELCAQN